MMNLLKTSIAAILAFGISSAAMAACSDPAGPKVNWSGCDLSGANLDSANLFKADLSGANLENAVLTYANLDHAIMKNANLRGAHMSNSSLIVTDLFNADLRGADLRGATVEHPTKGGWSIFLDAADLRGALWIDGRTCDEKSYGVCH